MNFDPSWTNGNPTLLPKLLYYFNSDSRILHSQCFHPFYWLSHIFWESPLVSPFRRIVKALIEDLFHLVTLSWKPIPPFLGLHLYTRLKGIHSLDYVTAALNIISDVFSNSVGSAFYLECFLMTICKRCPMVLSVPTTSPYEFPFIRLCVCVLYSYRSVLLEYLHYGSRSMVEVYCKFGYCWPLRF